MKKTLLIASIVAMAMGAQAQVYEQDFVYESPFEKYGIFDYVQAQNDNELGKWFLIDIQRGSRYPIVENCNDTARIKICFGLAIVLDISDVFPKGNDNNEINVRFKINHKNMEDYMNNVSVYTFEKNENLVRDLPINKGTYKVSEDIKINGQYYSCEKIKIEKNENYILISIGQCDIGTSFYLSDVEITGTNGLEKDNKKYKEYFKYQYFHETYLFSELENNNNNQEIPTSINTMESNTYVSNNVLYTDEPSSVYIFNAGGILVKTENNTTLVDLSDLKKGVYIAKVNGAPIRFVR